jgi:hypothetical protein
MSVSQGKSLSEMGRKMAKKQVADGFRKILLGRPV